MALLRCASAFQLRKLAQNVRLTSGAIGARHFWWKFSNKIISIAQAPTKCAAKFWGLMARLRRPSAFRLCRLAQNVRLTSGANFSGAAFLLQILESNSYFDCAGSHKTNVRLTSGVSHTGSSDTSKCISTAQAHAKRAANFRGLA